MSRLPFPQNTVATTHTAIAKPMIIRTRRLATLLASHFTERTAATFLQDDNWRNGGIAAENSRSQGQLVKWRVESRTGAVTVVSRWLIDVAFAAPPQSGLAWFCFLFPLIEPDRQISRIRLSEKTHDVPCDAVCNC